MDEKKIRLAILRELEKGNRNIIHNNFELNVEDFVRLSKFLESQGLISGVKYFHNPRVDFTNASITLEGEKYLSDNSKIMKTYKGLKEFRDWFKL